MKEAQTAVVYIGYPKAASTFLDNYLGSHPEICRTPVRLTPLGAASLDSVHVITGGKLAKGQVNIFTNEKIAESVIVTGEGRVWRENMFIPGAWDKVAGHVRIDPLETAMRVKRGYGAARALIVIRDQIDWLQSAYKYFLPKLPARRRSFADFCTTPRGLAYLKVGHFDQTIQAYLSVFGPCNVQVMRTEDLQKNPEIFAAELCGFLGVETRAMPRERANAGSTNRAAAIRARFPIVEKLPLRMRTLGKKLVATALPAQPPVIADAQADELRSRYDESNRRTNALIKKMTSAALP